jgi:hypothetical protein
MNKTPPVMLTLQKFSRMTPDEVGLYHGYGDFITFIMSTDLDELSTGSVTYKNYCNWYYRKHTDLGKALSE